MNILQSVEQAARCGELDLEEQEDKELSETIIQELRDEYPDAKEEGLRKTAELELKRRKDIEELNAKIKALQQPKNLKDLKKKLNFAKKLWLLEHTKHEPKGKTAVTKCPPALSDRIVTDILEKNMVFAVIGEDEADYEKAPLRFYNPDSGLYTQDERILGKLALIIKRDITTSGNRNIMRWLRLEAKEKKLSNGMELIPVGNGVYNRRTQTLSDFNPYFVFTSKIKTEWRADIAEPNINGWTPSKFLLDLANGNPDKAMLLKQILGCCVCVNHITDKAFFLIDDEIGSTGKSTFEQAIINLVGDENAGSLLLKEFEEPFTLATAMDKTVIIGDDNHPGDYNEKSVNFKRMVTGERILVNPKGLPPYTSRSKATVIQSMNSIPKFADTTGGLTRRIVMIKFNHHFKKTPEGDKVKHDYIYRDDVLEWLLHEALETDISIIRQLDESAAELHKMELESDPVLYYMEIYFPLLKSTRIPTYFLFKDFLAHMASENRPSRINQSTFTKRARKYLPPGWKSGKQRPGDGWKDQDRERLNDYISDNPKYHCQPVKPDDPVNCFYQVELVPDKVEQN
ncbi:phage/plasmid primase, P4 family [Ligilactobacillus ruminis]|uniref:Phage/plasmid primase, P4 family n=1 Tax=Ligilactobacillus ruminis TaxID=1623 RepID=A0AAQ2XL17_9LACO|nr:phage/plasmid primase, P4 family [Ligilactobacillus ruminis]WDC82504.1 phage/plasmid primase, P4 family [Ligilactobacillus ruminis]